MTGTLYALALVVTSLRLYTRAKVRFWKWDDSFALFAALSMSLFVAGMLATYSIDGVYGDLNGLLGLKERSLWVAQVCG